MSLSRPGQLFLSGLLNLQESGLLTEVDPTKMFSNIQDLVRLHTALWGQVMLPALQQARQARALLDPAALHHGFNTVSGAGAPTLIPPSGHSVHGRVGCSSSTEMREEGGDLFNAHWLVNPTMQSCKSVEYWI